MGQDDTIGQHVAPTRHVFGDRAARRIPMPIDRVAPDYDRQLQSAQPVQQFAAPEIGTNGRWWQIAALAAAGIAEGHGHDGEERRVVECRAIDAEPAAQSIARWIVEGHALRMGDPARSLARNQDPGAGAPLDYRTRTKRQAFALRAGTHTCEECFVLRFRRLGHRSDTDTVTSWGQLTWNPIARIAAQETR